MYEQLQTFVDRFVKQNPPVPVDGEYYELPGTVVYRQSTYKLPERGRIEVNQTTPEAPTEFEWASEITINDKSSGSFIHLLLRRDGEVVETYGKTVTPVDTARAAEILDLLQGLYSA